MVHFDSVKLTKRQRNEVFATIEAHGVSPAEMEFAPTDVDWKVRHLPTDSWFNVRDLQNLLQHLEMIMDV